MHRVGSHAVVIGASMAGLLAARALSGPYERVTVLDRDELPEHGDRKGVPQGRHFHGLLPRGGLIMEAMFPGLLEEIEATGTPVVRNWARADMSLGGHPFSRDPHPIDPPVYATSRPLLEGKIRARLRGLPGVELLAATEATDLLVSARGSRVTGVRTVCDRIEQSLSADLVLDATGRTGRAPVWLQALGYGPVGEESIQVDVRYASRRLRMPADALGGREIIFIGAAPGLPRAAAFGRVEGHDQWLISLGGYTREHHPPTDEAGFLAFAETFLPEYGLVALRTAEPLGPIVGHNFPTMLRRHYQRLDRFPGGFLVFGDAFASFNPLYGQGMTVAALQAESLRACLLDRRGETDLAHRFFTAAAKPVDIAWQMAGGADLSLPVVPGKRPLQVKVLNAYMERLLNAAETKIWVGHTFWRVAGFLDPPARLFAPDLLRAAFGGRRGAAPLMALTGIPRSCSLKFLTPCLAARYAPALE